jgi:hypothetical protein
LSLLERRADSEVVVLASMVVCVARASQHNDLYR